MLDLVHGWRGFVGSELKCRLSVLGIGAPLNGSKMTLGTTGPTRNTGLSRGVGLMAVVLALLGLAGPADATLLVYNFSGTVQSNGLGILFPGKNVGDPFSGSFTLDTGANQVVPNGNSVVYPPGGFNLTVDATTFALSAVQVWSGGPAIVSAPDGFEMGFVSQTYSGFLSFRSSSDI